MFQTGPAITPSAASSIAFAPSADYYAELSSSWGGLTLPGIDNSLSDVTEAAVASVGAVGLFSALFNRLWKMAWD